MYEVRYATEAQSNRRGAATSNAADEAMTRQKARELLRQGAERRKAATATTTRRQTTSTPLVSPPPKRRPPTKTQMTATTPSTSKVDGDGAAAPAKDKPPLGNGTGYRGYGKPFEKGNRLQQRARNRLTDEQIRDEVRCAMSKVSLRQIVRRQIRIAVKGSNRDASTAARLLMTLVGADEVAKGNASGPGSMIVMPSPPER